MTSKTKTKTVSKTAHAAARARGAAAQMDRAKSLAAAAEQVAMKAIVEGARAVMQGNSLASDYVQAMGMWSFTVIAQYRDDGFFEEAIGSNDASLESLRDRSEDFDPAYAALVGPFIDAVKAFRELHDAYQETFGKAAAGAPMRFQATGPITTDW